MCISRFQPLKSHKRRIILDTDIGPDVDDVGAIAVLFTLAKRYNIEVAGIINCTSNTYGSGAIDALMNYCGYPNIPIGQYSKEEFLGESIFYNKFLSEFDGQCYGNYKGLNVRLYRNPEGKYYIEMTDYIDHIRK